MEPNASDADAGEERHAAALRKHRSSVEALKKSNERSRKGLIAYSYPNGGEPDVDAYFLDSKSGDVFVNCRRSVCKAYKTWNKREWVDAMFMVQIALSHGTEGDSDGSMLTRAALVFLYAMVDAELSIVSQWKTQDMPSAFHAAEILFLNEVAAGVGHDGEIWVDGDQHPFKKRVKAIPAILSRVVDGKELTLNLGTDWGTKTSGRTWTTQ